MSTVGFFTPVQYQSDGSWQHRARQWSEDFFPFVKQEKAYVIHGSTSDVVFRDVCREKTSVLKVISVATIVIPLIALAIKAYYRCQQSFTIINVKSKLSEGIKVPKEALEALGQIFTGPIDRKKLEELHHWERSGSLYTFILPEYQDLAFTFEADHMKKPLDTAEKRLDHFAASKAAALFLGLEHVVIPPTQAVRVLGQNQKSYKVLVQKAYTYEQESSRAKKELQAKKDLLDKPVEDLARLVCETGMTAIHSGRIKLIDEDGKPKFLVKTDPYSFNTPGATHGIYYESFEMGLLSMLYSEKLVDIALEVAKEFKMELDFEKVREACVARVKRQNKLDEYHKAREIRTGKEEIVVKDLSTLGLDLSRKARSEAIGEKDLIPDITMEDAIKLVIETLNESFVRTGLHCKASPERRRFIDFFQVLVTLDHLQQIGQGKNTWLIEILNALQKTGHLFSVEVKEGDEEGIYIQA